MRRYIPKGVPLLPVHLSFAKKISEEGKISVAAAFRLLLDAGIRQYVAACKEKGGKNNLSTRY